MPPIAGPSGGLRNDALFITAGCLDAVPGTERTSTCDGGVYGEVQENGNLSVYYPIC